MNEDQPVEYEKTDRFESKRKMPRVPDLSAPPKPMKSAPFILDDFKGSDAYKGTKP